MTTYQVRSSNGSRYQVHDVGAEDEESAIRLAEAAANAAAESGAEPAGRYTAYRCVETEYDVPIGVVRFVGSATAEG
ncbi:MAG: hypothetical protein H0U59_13100 [Gemmatimonadaceae bacterium]|nr:hypothetical protein [Gemmatimonadaceae bacterium]